MKFHIEFTPEQFEFLSGLLCDIVQLYEHEAAALGTLLGEGARDLAQERLDAAQDAAELVALLADIQEVPHG